MQTNLKTEFIAENYINKPRLRASVGLTLIELMVVVIIIGILATIAIPNLMQAQDKAKNAAVISNARALASNIQINAVDSGGVIPESIYDLEDAGVVDKLVNPFTQQPIEVEDIVDGICDPEQDEIGTLCYQAGEALAEPFKKGVDTTVETKASYGSFVITGIGAVGKNKGLVVAIDNG